MWMRPLSKGVQVNDRETTETPGHGPALYTAVARNSTGVNGESTAEGGLTVAVASPPTGAGSAPAGTTNPEELLALSWATCLNAAARVVAGVGVEVSARVEISLHARGAADGYEFSGRAELFFAGIEEPQAEALAAAAHARCPVSRMLAGTSRVEVAAVGAPR